MIQVGAVFLRPEPTTGLSASTFVLTRQWFFTFDIIKCSFSVTSCYSIELTPIIYNFMFPFLMHKFLFLNTCILKYFDIIYLVFLNVLRTEVGDII